MRYNDLVRLQRSGVKAVETVLAMKEAIKNPSEEDRLDIDALRRLLAQKNAMSGHSV